jgi:hypothetical protein
MTSNIAAAVAAAGLWAVFGAAIISGTDTEPGTTIWVVSSSDKTTSHPALGRAAAPPATANLKAALLVRP